MLTNRPINGAHMIKVIGSWQFNYGNGNVTAVQHIYCHFWAPGMPGNQKVHSWIPGNWKTPQGITTILESYTAIPVSLLVNLQSHELHIAELSVRNTAAMFWKRGELASEKNHQKVKNAKCVCPAVYLSSRDMSTPTLADGGAVMLALIIGANCRRICFKLSRPQRT